MTRTTTELEQLREQIRSVRESILTAVVRMDDIELQQIPAIRADYALKIGCWEQALLEAELAARRAKRRLALAQAQANQGDAPQLSVIDTQLDTELADWSAKAEQARRAYERALSRFANTVPMKYADAAELRRLYRKLAKRLHPDMHAGDAAEQTDLFVLAQAAYHKGDIEALRSLEVATRHLDALEEDLQHVTDADALAQELELARIEEGVVQERLRELEECEEMRLGQLLASPQWVTERTTELRQATEEWNRVRRASEERLRQIMEAFDE